MKTVRRFIAGAVCPACKEMDTLMMWSEDNTPHRECMICGFSDTLDANGLSIPKELPTRVNTSSSPVSITKSIHFFPNPKLDKKMH